MRTVCKRLQASASVNIAPADSVGNQGFTLLTAVRVEAGGNVDAVDTRPAYPAASSLTTCTVRCGKGMVMPLAARVSLKALVRSNLTGQ